MKQKIILYGAGIWGDRIYNQMINHGETINHVVDSDDTKWGTLFHGVCIESPKVICEQYEQPLILLAIQDEQIADEVKNSLYEKGIYSDNIWNLTRIKLTFFSSFLSKSTPKFHKKKKIFFECRAGLEMGGVQIWTQKITSILQQEKYDTCILTKESDYPISQELYGRSLFFRQDVFLSYDEKKLQALYDVLIENLPCTIVMNSVNSLFLIVQAIKKKWPNQITLIMVVHSGYKALYKEVAEYKDLVDKYVAISHDILSGLVQEKIEVDKIVFSDFYIKTSRNLQRNYSSDIDSIKIGYAGRLTIVQKRVDLLIKLINSLECKKVNYVMTIAGEGEFFHDLQDYIKSQKLETKVRLVGKVDHELMDSFWLQQDIGVVVSDEEGICLSNLEAMASGCVPIITKTSAREYIIDGKNGYLVPIGGIEEMSGKIQYLEKNRKLLSSIGANAYNTIRQRCSRERELQVWKKLLN